MLDDFESSLKASGLSDKTIRGHLQNVDLYINYFLLYESAVEAKDGSHSVSMFLGYSYIKKVMPASSTNIRSNAASLKKFYSFLADREIIGEHVLSDLEETIKADMPTWLAKFKTYENYGHYNF